MSTPLRRRLVGVPDLQGRWAHRPAVSRWSCLGVLAVVPGHRSLDGRSGSAD
jgi:hypothetical protein